MKILLAVDGSSYTKKMLAYLATHDELFGAAQHDYTAFTVQPALPLRVRAAVDKEIAEHYYAEETEKILAPVSAFLTRHSMAVKSQWQMGPVGETIANFADSEKFDLLIMGSHGHSALGNLVMGSVTTQVLAHSKIPVLLIR